MQVGSPLVLYLADPRNLFVVVKYFGGKEVNFAR
jgi:hypothetical protein